MCCDCRQLSVFTFSLFFFNDTATTEIYTLSLHDALPICSIRDRRKHRHQRRPAHGVMPRSEEHTSELQSLRHLVCRLLLEKKKKKKSKKIKNKKKKYKKKNKKHGIKIQRRTRNSKDNQTK